MPVREAPPPAAPGHERLRLPGGRERLGLALCVAVAFVLRYAHWERAAVLFNDGPVFLALAARAAAGSFETLLQHPFHPLYPLAIAALHALAAPFGIGFETAAALTSALAGSAAVLALYALVSRAFGAREGLVAAWLLALHAGAAEMAGDIQSEALYLALFLASVAALWRASEEGSRAAALAAGLFSGLAYLTRPEGLGVALVGGGLLLLRGLRGHLAPARAAGLALAIAAGAASISLPYVAALSLESGELLLTRKKTVSWVVGAGGPAGPGGLATGQPGMEAPKVREHPPRPERPGRASKRAAAGRAAPTAPEPDPYDSLVPPSWTARSATAALFDLLDDTVSALRPEMTLLVVIGLLALRGAPGRRAGFFAALIGAYGSLLFALAMNVGYVSERHALPPVLLLLGYGAAGALRAGGALARLGGAEPTARRARLATAAVLAAVALICVGKTLRKPEGLDDLAERRAAEWIAARDAGSVVAGRKRRVAYYARGPFVQLRPKTREGFLRYFDDHAVDYVVVNEIDVEEYVGLDDLFGDRLREVHRVESAGQVALVFAYDAPGTETAR